MNQSEIEKQIAEAQEKVTNNEKLILKD